MLKAYLYVKNLFTAKEEGARWSSTACSSP